MLGLPRFVIPDQPQHVIDRGNNRSEIFCADADCQFYVEKLQLACNEYDCKMHAYVRLTNHVHLLITSHAEDGLSKVMQMLSRYYVQYFNFTCHPVRGVGNQKKIRLIENPIRGCCCVLRKSMGLICGVDHDR